MAGIRACRECGKPIGSRRALSLFCSTECLQGWHRRRRERGAELYDFLMNGDGDTVERLLGEYRKADLAKRLGRPSYRSLRDAKIALPIAHGISGDGR